LFFHNNIYNVFFLDNLSFKCNNHINNYLIQK
jgi:hypothetical protein